MDDWSLQAQEDRNRLWEATRQHFRHASYRSALVEQIIEVLDDCANHIGEWAEYRMSTAGEVDGDGVLDDHMRLWGDCAAALSATPSFFPLPTFGMVVPFSGERADSPIARLQRGSQFGLGGAPPPVSHDLDELAFDLCA